MRSVFVGLTLAWALLLATPALANDTQSFPYAAATATILASIICAGSTAYNVRLTSRLTNIALANSHKADEVIALTTMRYEDETERRAKGLAKALDRCDEQIGKFYAPLSNLVQQLKDTDAIKQKISSQDQQHANDIEKFLYNYYFLPIHMKIARILESQLHLFDGEEVPECFTQYYKHVTSERLLYTIRDTLKKAKDEGKIPPELAETKFDADRFPDAFKDEIQSGLARVSMKQERLMRRLDPSRLYY